MLSSDETGSIASLEVEEGDSVTADQVIARLDVRVQELQLEIASHLATTTSQLEAATRSLRKRQAISVRLQELKAKGHASQSEIIRSEMELSIAEAKLLAAKEELTVREIEQRRAAVQLDRRTISSPFAGVVATVHRREGEYLSPLHPEIVTIIQIDQLIAKFPVQSSLVSSLQVGQEFEIELEHGTKVPAKVYRIGIETDAQSGTVEVKLIIDNSTRKIRAGEICTLNI
ncbi:MAG: RND family efflux transporter MFP subunit [Mariniblastus sp.]|jgi:RND family efflux transporter MFP subunit